MAWRVAGTDKFPSSVLPVVSGQFERWVEAGPSDAVKTIMRGFGARQREAHPVFFPLAVQSRIQDPQSTLMQHDCGPILKSGPWIGAAMDKHTSEGKRALGRFFRSCPTEDRAWLLGVAGGEEEVMSALGKLMFWMEGGRLDRFWSYSLAKAMDQDIKKKWQKHTGVSGSQLLQRFGQPEQWNKARGVAVAKSGPTVS